MLMLIGHDGEQGAGWGDDDTQRVRGEREKGWLVKENESKGLVGHFSFVVTAARQ